MKRQLRKLLQKVFVVFFLPGLAACQTELLQDSVGPVPVAVVRTADGYQLLRGGEPYVVRGAGLEDGDIESLVRHGGNSIRTWGVDVAGQSGQALLDRAHELGLTVALCLNIARERHGFDYDDAAAVASQKAAARVIVEKYKDHPALLAWIIGNELNYNYENPAVYDAVNDIAEMIDAIDPNHPTTTTTAGIDANLMRDITERAPALDFLSVQLYGDLINLPRYIAEIGYTGPYFVTEWGAIGHWEMPATRWGAPVEQTSSEKADNYLKGYRTVIEPYPDTVLGSYVFLWGQKQERTPTWYGMFTEDALETETVDVMHYIWTGSWPENRSPRLERLTLNALGAMENVTLNAGQRYAAAVVAEDPDGDTLSYAWSVKPESQATQHGGDEEAPIEDLTGLIDTAAGADTALTAPAAPGAYRLFVYVYDGKGHAAHANLPFFVETK